MDCTSRVKVTYEDDHKTPLKLELVCTGDCTDKKGTKQKCGPFPPQPDKKKLTRQFCACPPGDGSDPVEPKECHIVLVTDPPHKDVYFECKGEGCENKKEKCCPVAYGHKGPDEEGPYYILFGCCGDEDDCFPRPK